MRHKISAGLAAGLIAGLVLAVVMRLLPIWAANGRPITMIAVAARLIRAESPRAGWLASIVYAVVLGGLFGATLVARKESVVRTAILGGVWALGWFVITGLGLMPALLGSRPFSASAFQELEGIAVPLLVGHIAYGLTLGAGFRLILNAFSRPGSSGRIHPRLRRAA